LTEDAVIPGDSGVDIENVLRVLRQTDVLEALPRTGWVISRIPQPENVAAHSYGVALTAMILSDLIMARPEPPELDRSKAIEMALIHDMGEAYLTDIPSPVKTFVGRSLVKDGERRAFAKLVDGLGGRMLSLYDEYTAGQSLESRVVHAADKIQLFMKVNQYRAAGYTAVDRFWETSDDTDAQGIPEARTLLDRLAEHYRAGTWSTGDW